MSSSRAFSLQGTLHAGGDQLRLSLPSVILAITEATDLDAGLGVVLQRIGEATGWAFGQAWLPRHGRLHCSPRFHNSLPHSEPFRTLSEQTTFAPGVGLPGRAWALKVPVWVRDVTVDANFPRATCALEVGLRTGVAIPIIANDDVAAVIEFFMLEPHDADERLVETIVAVAAELGLLIRRKIAEDMLRASEWRLRSLVDSVKDAIVSADLEGNIISWNHGAEVTFGYTPQEAIGRPLAMLVPERHRAAHIAGLKRFRNSGEPTLIGKTVEMHGLRKDETEFPCELSLSTWKTAEGQFCTGIVRDVTQRKEMEMRLVVGERMASIGTLAAGVAHEINNPLAYVTANLDMIAEELRALSDGGANPRLKELEQMTNEARSGAERVRKIVRGLKTFSRADIEQRVHVDIHRVLDLSVNMTFNEIRHRATLVKEYGDVPHVEADEAGLGQVFINLLVNAAQSLPDGRADRNEIRIVTKTNGGGHAIIEVRDTGSGIPPASLKRIFDPFFTTKPVGTGTGLGLSICQSIVTSIGGTIEAESTLDVGTTFRVTLPAATRPAEKRSPSPSVRPLARRGRVLVIDDEAPVGMALRRMLSGEHDVSALTSGREALDVLLSGKEHFDVILCDLMMPDLTGVDLYWELHKHDPEQAERIIFITGGEFSHAAREFLDKAPNHRIEKPFDMQSVRAVVRDQLRVRGADGASPSGY